jgi:hypothetical protein
VRRPVRITEDFLRRLDAQLPPDRDGATPSRRDFEIHDLLRIVDMFADSWDWLMPSYRDRSEYREWSGVSDLGLAIWVQGQLAPDGAIELVGLEVDTAPPWGEDQDDDSADS